MGKVKGYEIIQNKDMIQLHANESCFPLSDKVKKAFIEQLNKVEFQRYPETDAYSLREAYASYLNLNTENVLCGNGSDEMLGLMINTNIWKDDKVLTLSLDFSMYDYFVSFNDGKMVKYPVNKDGSFDVSKFIQLGKESDVKMVLFSNPNNPTGYALKNKELIKIVEAFKDIPVIIDEAYGEFFEETMVDEIKNYDNLYVTKTLSKAFGLASARIGFLISNEENIKKLSKFKEPYTVNTLSSTLAKLQLKEKDEILKQIKVIKQLRNKLYKDLKEIDSNKFWVNKSDSNFIYGKTSCKDKLLKELEKNNILIRNYDGESFRITVGNKDENELVVNVFKKVFGKEE